MSKRIVIPNAILCPFCGCEKIFVKAKSEGTCMRQKRYAVSCQCSKCHVHGPQIFSEWHDRLPSFNELHENTQNRLISEAVEKWNTRFSPMNKENNHES